MFVLYTSPVLDLLSSYGLLGHAYADDTQAYKHCKIVDLADTLNLLQRSFSALSDWMLCNRLKLNANKTELIIFGSKYNLAKVTPTSISLNGVTVPISDSVRNLGIILDAELNFKLHSKKLTSTCFLNIKQIWQIRNCLTKSACETLVHAFVSSRLDYCNSVFAGLTKSVLHSLQLIQNAAARLVTRTNKREHISPVLIDLHWLPISQRITFKIAVLVYKSLSDACPSPRYLSLQSVSSVAGRRSLRSAARNDLLVPKYCTATYGQRPFSVVGPTVWNSLPLSLRQSVSLDSFKSGLKTFLMTMQ